MSTSSSSSHVAGSAGARWGLLQISVAGVLWGTGGLAVELVRETAPLSPLTISAHRTGLAAVVLLAAVVVVRRSGQVRELLAAHPVQTTVVGLLTAAYQALYFASVVLVGVTVSTVVSLGVAPLLLTAADAVRRRRLPAGREAVPVVVALLGLVLVSGTAGLGETGPQPVLGVLAALASGSAYAAATALGEPLARRTDPLALTTATTTIGALGLVPVAVLATAVGGGTLVTGDPRALAVLAYLGVLTFALAYLLLYAGLRTTASSAAVLATLLEPVTAAVVAALVLGERLGPPGLAGMVLVLLAIASLGRQAPRVPAP
jgi:drug/metabolite transporter, DME family